MSNATLELLSTLDRIKAYDDDFVLEEYKIHRPVVEVGETDGYADYRSSGTMTITLTLRAKD